MTSLYEISYYGIEQHITLTLSALHCSFTVRNYMTLFNTFHFMRAVGVVVCLSLRMANVTGSRRTQYSVVSVIFYCYHCFVVFALFFTQWLIYQFSFHIDILISTFIFHLANLCVVAKIEMHVKIGDIFVPYY